MLGAAECHRFESNSKFTILVLQLAVIFGVMGIGGILLAWVGGEQILTLIYRREYSQDRELFLYLTISGAIGYVSSAFGYAITAARYFRVQILSSVVITATSTLGCLWLIPQMGMKGAALSLIMTAAVQVLLNSIVIAHALRKLK